MLAADAIPMGNFLNQRNAVAPMRMVWDLFVKSGKYPAFIFSLFGLTI